MNRQLGLISLGSILGLLLFSATAVIAGQSLSVHVGESTTLNLPYQFSDMAVGNPAIADYVVRANTVGKSEVIINGKQAGKTNLLIWDKDGKKRQELAIVVYVRDLKAHLALIKSMVGPAEGITYRIAGDKILIEGQAILPKVKERIAKVVGNSPQVVDLVTISPITMKVTAKSINDALRNPSIKATPVGQKIMLQGVVYSETEAKRAIKTASLYFPQVVNLLEVRKSDLAPGPGEMIQVTAHFMEVNNSVIDGWGVNWSPFSSSALTGQQGIGTGAGFVGAVTGTITSLFPKFNRAKEVGGARILETSSVSVRSGEKGRLFSGGEIGVPISLANGGMAIQFKEHGVFLDVLPIAQNQDVTLRVKVEVSQPTGTSPGGFINFKKSNITTTQFCNSGQSIVLGGLISNRDTKIFDKLPEGASGALMQLYSSEDFRKQRSQLVVFLTPIVLKGGARDANRELKGKVEGTFNSYEERKR